MPAVVISLLSSPDVAPASVQRPGRVQRVEPWRPGPPKRTLGAAGDNVFDLTGDAAQSRPVRQPPSEYSAGTKRPNQAAAHQHDFLFLSDDFDTTGELGGGPGDWDRHAKKPRLPEAAGGRETHARHVQRASSRGRATGPNIPEPAGFRKWSSAIDPIISTSSPVLPASSNTAARAVLDDDDPFASSPMLPRAKPPPPPRGTVNSLLVPPRVDNEALPRTSRAPVGSLGSDPFASSPPRPRGAAPSKEPTTWDHISSSAPEARVESDPPRSPVRALTRTHSEVIHVEDSDTPQESDNELPDLGSVALKKANRRTRGPKTTGRPQVKGSKPAPRRSAEDVARERDEKSAAREAEKLRKQREKELAKEQKAREKERAAAIAEVNKVRTDKKVSVKEMIVDLPSSLNRATTLQIETLLKDINVQHHPWPSPVDNVVKWRRKVESRYDEELGRWEPIPMRVEPEKHALVIMTAGEFVELALGGEGANLESHVFKMRQHFAGHTLLYLIEGLTPWMRKNRNVRNRQFVSAVRNAGEDSSAPPASGQQQQQRQQASRRRKTAAQPQQYISEDSVEDALLELQVLHGALIHHTAAAVETAQWVSIFTQHMSTIPYRRQREAANAEAAAFCMESGQVRTGDGARDTYVRMLQEIARVTAPIAYGIAAELGTVAELVRGLEQGGPLRLEAVRKSANKDGAFSDRAIGQAVSRRIYKVFTGRDERSTDV